MASTYTPEELKGAGIPLKEDLTAGSTYTFTITNKELQGDAYLFFETIPHDSSLPLYISGSVIAVVENCGGAIIEDYKAGIVIHKSGSSSFEITPTVEVAGSYVYLKATGGIGALLSGGDPIITSGLLMYHKYISTETVPTRTLDYSPQAFNTGSLYSGKGLSYDGVNDYTAVSTFDEFDGNGGTDFAVAVKIKTTEAGTNKLFAAHYDAAGNNRGWFMALSGGKFKVVLSEDGSAEDKDYISTESVNDGVERTLGFRFVAGVLTMSINGVDITPTKTVDDTCNTINSSTVDVTFGANYFVATPSNFIAATIGMVKFWTTCTDAQLLEFHNQPEDSIADSTNVTAVWPTLEGVGTIIYEGIGNNYGTINGATWVHAMLDPFPQTALMSWNKPPIFNGTDVMISGSSVDALTSHSICSWFVIDSLGTSALTLYGEDVTSKRRGMIIWDNGHPGNYTLRNSTFGSNPEGSTYLEEDRLYFGCVTMDATGSAKIYLDGLLDGSGSNSVLTPSANTLKIGSNGSSEWLNGLIHGIKIFDTVLTDSQVLELYNTSSLRLPTGISESALKGFWKINDTGTNILDYSSGSNDGTLQGTVSRVLIPEGIQADEDVIKNDILIPRVANSINLDGNSYESINATSSLDLTTAVTLEAWSRGTDASNYGHIISKLPLAGTAYVIANDINTGYFLGQINGSVQISTTDIKDGDWHYLAMTYDKSQIILYVDGVAIHSASYSADITTNSEDVQIGARPDGIQLIDVDIALPKVYSSSLSPADILINYSAHSASFL